MGFSQAIADKNSGDCGCRSALPAATAEAAPAFFIVGIGASAGGLEALEKFFSAVPPDCGRAFVVVTHLHPGHVSLLPELLGKCTRMRVLVATDGAAVQPNTVYMSLPEGYLALRQGTLRLLKPENASLLRLPIDSFFQSLAADQKERAIGIILSGTGTDGTLGLKAIKGVGGMTLAQEPNSARYSGMPASAIATGMVDYVLPVEQLPRQLTACAGGAYQALAGPDVAKEAGLSEPMQKIIVLLRGRTGNDFASYKANTIRRRIERRINVHRLKSLQGYLRLVQENPHELDLLFHELLIGVTNFFRDPKAFAALAKIVRTILLARRPENLPVRVWVPGCSTGAEAYSLAILLQEAMDKLKKYFPVQIFGTDLDPAAIASARTGCYPDSIARDLSPQRLSRFFLKHADGYRIKREIRDRVIFAPQNVLKDPPFTKLDLVSCRNLLIYFKAEAQQRLLSLFHYALKPGGILFLGTSEGITGLSDYFTLMHKKSKIFTRKERIARSALPAGFATPTAQGQAFPGGATGTGQRARKQLLSVLIEKTLLTRYAPACVIVNNRGDIVYIHGRTGDYLEPAIGQPRLNILDMAREGLRIELSLALRRAATQKGAVRCDGVRVKTNGHFTSVRLTVTKLAEPESVRGLLLVTFEPEPAGKPVAGGLPARRRPPQKPARRISELECELQYAKENLQSTVEELESSNEELKSTNEELQSINEELETSKEEMQSLNEELQTVNAQLQGKLEDLAQSHDDMANLLTSTASATIFLDQKLHIKRFTAEATKLIKLIHSDLGRPIGDLASNLDYDQLSADATEVLRRLMTKEKEVKTKGGEWWQVRITPYRTKENMIDGLVLTFSDITRLKTAELAAQQAHAYAENIIATLREPFLVLDERLLVFSASRAFYRLFKTSAKEVEHRLIYQISGGRWRLPALRRLLEGVLRRNQAFEGFKVRQEFPGIGRKTLLLNARRLVQETGAPGMILLAFEDITGTPAVMKKTAVKRKDSVA